MLVNLKAEWYFPHYHFVRSLFPVVAVSQTITVEVPSVGESITEVQVGQWLKREGDSVTAGEDLVEIETEKASVPVPSPASGTLIKILKRSEEFANVGDAIASIAVGAVDGAATNPSASVAPSTSPKQTATAKSTGTADAIVMPAAQRLLDEHGLTPEQVPATGPGNRLLKEDVLNYVQNMAPVTPSAAPPTSVASKPASTSTSIAAPARRETSGTLMTDTLPNRTEEVKPMSMLRRTIAARLVEAQQTAALLTTFNEIDMQPVMDIRTKYKEAFAEKHGAKLGFMSFFAKAAVEGLRRFPAINAEIRESNIVYRQYQDIGIAIGGGKGLVVPVLRNVERMSFADVERSIANFAKLAGENRLQPADLIGGTFTISNGGVYGSLLSTPIVNPPQSGILGLHSIQDRPVAVNGQVVIRPMMYIALTYDHRIVDGREAVGFLKTIKEVIEDPARLFLEL
jgi:2-oxoglutarate dehydrogenase E2 component (dihydrolipoamide succinyltransferase)